MQPEVVDDQPRLIASRLHLAVFLWIQLAMALSGGNGLRWLVSAPDPHAFHVRLVCYYLLLLVWEWALLCYVWYGVRKTGTSLRTLIGGRWISAWEIAKDVGIAVAFWVIWIVAVIAFAKITGLQHQLPKTVLAMFPTTGLEIALWIAMSATAGFCEEVMYRGYLQRQFLAMSKSVWVAVIGQGLLFGLVHIYQGLQGAITISVMGILFGALAAWQRNLRPGMIAHAWHDGFVGVMMYLMYLLRHVGSS